MKRLIAVSRTAFLRRVLMIVLAGFVVLTTTACNSGDSVGARPNNPPVQMGGQNNPHKAGGDGYSEYKTTIDRSGKPNQPRASLPGNVLIAADNNAGMQYPGVDPQTKGISKDRRAIRDEMLKDAKRIPAVPQYELDRNDPSDNVPAKARRVFDEATEFAKDSTLKAAKGSSR